MEQRSQDWFAARVGKVTASRLGDVLARTQKGWGAARAKYLNQLVAERLTGIPQDMRRIKSLDDRSELEPEARDAYAFYYDANLELVGFIEHPTIPMVGASPDSLVGDDGVLEIKCLDAATHVKLLSGDESVIEEYFPQTYLEIACTERNWCDLVAYQPHMPEELKLARKRIERDDKKIAEVEKEIRAFLAEVDAKVEQLLSLKGGEICLSQTLESSIQMLSATR